MFRIKICGITSAQDATLAASLGADAIGINFYEGSKRHVRLQDAFSIVEAVRGAAVPVAVFVNESPEVIMDVCGKLGIGVVQLSGNEPPAMAEKIGLRRIKSIHLRERREIDAYRDYPCEVFLLDAYVHGEFGGTGKTLEWEKIGGAMPGKPWMLAGGLDPENVLEAIRLARPDGVDVASGVESEPGRKAPDKLMLFIKNARKGFNIERE
jgi:phosphoribosylanthranilate isomerase